MPDEENASLERRDGSVEPASEFQAVRAIRLSVANYNTTLSSDSLDTGDRQENSHEPMAYRAKLTSCAKVREMRSGF
jgi:hypothetical protein